MSEIKATIQPSSTINAEINPSSKVTATTVGIHNINAAAVGLGNVTNESKATMFTDPTFTGSITGTLGTASQPTITSVGTLTSASISGDLTVDTSTLKVDSTNNRVGIGTTTPTEALDVTGNIKASGSITGANLVAAAAGIKFSNYTSAAVGTITSSINPNQNNIPATGAVGNDTTTDLAVDQTGNVVRTTQEATWLLTKAQIDGLAAGSSGKVTLIQAPGANKFVLVEKATFLINYAYNGGTMNSGQSYNIQQDGNKTNNIAILPATKILDVVKDGQSASSSDTYGIYEADTGHSILNRSYKPDKAITLSKNNSSTLATAVTSITIKIRYRVYDVASF